MTTVANIHKRQEFDVYIGRAGKGQDGYFGNPIRLDGKSREDVLTEYKAYFLARLVSDAEFKRRVDELRGKRLGCFCAPQLCHGMVIVEYLDGTPVKDQMEKMRPPSQNIFDDYE